MPSVRDIASQSPRFDSKIGVRFSPFSVCVYSETDTPFDAEFTCGSFNPEFVAIVLRRGLSPVFDVDKEVVFKFKIPTVDSETQLAYVAAVEAFEPIEDAFNSNKKQFDRAEIEFFNNSSSTSCEYFRSLSETNVQSIGEKLRQLNVRGFRGLLEALPYHLASILRLFDASNRSKDKLEHLQHFFEAAAAYHATLLFSTLMNRPEEARREFSAIDERLSRFSLSLGRSTFGTWVACVESFPRFFEEGGPKFERLLAIRSIKSACSSPVIAAFRFANQSRNGGSGHGGHINEAAATKSVALLSSHLNSYLESTAELWDDLILISQPEIKDFKNGEIAYAVKALVGTRADLVGREIKLIADSAFSDGLSMDGIYFYSLSAKKAFYVVDTVGLDGPHPGDVMLPVFFNRVKANDPACSEYKCYSESLPSVIRKSHFVSNWPAFSEKSGVAR